MPCWVGQSSVFYSLADLTCGNRIAEALYFKLGKLYCFKRFTLDLKAVEIKIVRSALPFEQNEGMLLVLKTLSEVYRGIGIIVFYLSLSSLPSMRKPMS